MGIFAAPGEWMELDPDYRRPAPKTGLYCCRCQKALIMHEPQSLTICEVNYDTLQVRSNPIGNAMIGSDCWKQVVKAHKKSKK